MTSTFKICFLCKHTVYQLAEAGKQYAFYCEDVEQNKIPLHLPAGNYTLNMISIEDGATISLGRKNHTGVNSNLIFQT